LGILRRNEILFSFHCLEMEWSEKYYNFFQYYPLTQILNLLLLLEKHVPLLVIFSLINTFPRFFGTSSTKKFASSTFFGWQLRKKILKFELWKWKASPHHP
jgi:hypothetical protein